MAEHITNWLALAAVRPVAVWDRGTVQITQRGVGVFGEVTQQLLFACTGTTGLSVCESCSRPYVPHRRPRRHERHYCSECGRRCVQRDAARDYRERVRIARRPKS